MDPRTQIAEIDRRIIEKHEEILRLTSEGNLLALAMPVHLPMAQRQVMIFLDPRFKNRFNRINQDINGLRPRREHLLRNA